MSSPGAPTRDVLLVSAIITVSLSVTVVLCGLCHWCQRKLVRLLRALGTGPGLAPRPPQLQAGEHFQGRALKSHLPARTALHISVHVHTARMHALRFPACWPHMSVCTPKATHLGTHSWTDRNSAAVARNCTHTRPTSCRKNRRHTRAD